MQHLGIVDVETFDGASSRPIHWSYQALTEIAVERGADAPQSYGIYYRGLINLPIRR